MISESLRKLRPDFLRRELEKIILPDCRTLLDVGCGENSVVRNFKNKNIRKIGLDIFPEAIEKSKKRNIHDEYICGNALEIDKLFESKSIDCVMALDLVEHLEKEEAAELIRKMEKIAKRAVVIQTPNGFFPQGEYEDNRHQVHKCGFSSEELKKMGFKVVGMDGPKFFRKKSFDANQPNVLYSIVANILDPVYRFFPEKSFNLLAYKYLDE